MTHSLLLASPPATLLSCFKFFILSLALSFAVSVYAQSFESIDEANLSKVEQLIDAAREAGEKREYSISLGYLQQALLLFKDKGDAEAQALHTSLYCQIGAVHIEQGRWPEADNALLRCLQRARTEQEKPLISEALVLLGQNGFKQGHFEAAESYLQEAITLTTATEDLPRLAFAYLWLGAVAALRGDAELAETQLMQAVTISRRAGVQTTEGRARNILGENARLNGQYGLATTHYYEALAIYESINNRFGMTMVVHNLGHLATMMGDTEEALEHYNSSLKMAMEISAVPAALEILAALAGIVADAGDTEYALEILGLVLAHPASPKEALHMFAEPTLIKLKNTHPADVIEAGLARGRVLKFEAVVESLLKPKDKL